MLTRIAQTIFLYIISWGLWRIFKIFSVKSTLGRLPGPPPVSSISGNLKQVYGPFGVQWQIEMVKKYGRVFKLNGLLGAELLYVTDPKALQHIVVKDQHVYEETANFLAMNKLLFGNGLLATLGEHHKKQRKLLNPVFSPANMRNLYPIFNQIAYRLRAVLAKEIADGTKETDMLLWMSRAALEYIGQGGLGYSFDRLDSKNDENVYSRAVKDLLPSAFPFVVYRPILPFLTKLGPPGFRRFIVGLVPSRSFRRLKTIVDIMHNTSTEVFKSKKRALALGDEAVANQVGEGKDIMSILLKANLQANDEDRLSEEELLGQMNTLIFAAYDTTSSVLCRIIHILILHPGAQSRLREEVVAARAERNGGDLDYDELNNLPYLDAVVRETLRLYPALPFTVRTARQDISLPLTDAITVTAPGGGQTVIDSIPVQANTNLILGTTAVNWDPLIWGPDAAEWRPERWMGNKFSEVAAEKLPGVYSGMMSFWGGGRSCVGFKFALLEMKVAMSTLIETFQFDLPQGKEIIWRNSTFMTPTTKGRENDTPHLPVRLSLVTPVES